MDLPYRHPCHCSGIFYLVWRLSVDTPHQGRGRPPRSGTCVGVGDVRCDVDLVRNSNPEWWFYLAAWPGGVYFLHGFRRFMVRAEEKDPVTPFIHEGQLFRRAG